MNTNNTSKRMSSTTSPHGAANKGREPTSPIRTPGISDLDDSTNAYTAIRANRLQSAERNSFDDVEDRGLRDGESESGDIEMRDVESNQPMTKAGRLRLNQLERFKRILQERDRRAKLPRSQSASRWTAKTRGHGNGTDAPAEFDNLFHNGSRTGGCRELNFTNHPWPMWIFGGLLLIAASVFVNQIHQKHYQDALERKSYWYKYVVAIVIYFMGVGVIMNGRVERFSMSKDTGMLLITSTKPLCFSRNMRRTRQIERELRTIVDVRVEAFGEILSGEVDTRMFKIHFDFMDGTHTTALDGRSKQKALIRCRLIKQFLLSCGPVQANSACVRRLSATAMALGNGELMEMPPIAVEVAVDETTPMAMTPGPAPLSPRKIMMVASVPTSTLSQRPGHHASTMKSTIPVPVDESPV